MKEIAFTVNPDSELYINYFKKKDEKAKFHSLAKKFFEDNGITGDYKYYQTEFLGIKLNSEQKERFCEQLKKYDDENGMSIFKKNSIMRKLWNETVTSKVDFKVLNATNCWQRRFINYGSYNLWDYNGVLYGYLEDKYKDDILIADYMTEIKMSEYYSVIEQIENN